jgi:hypothetical protein
LTALDAVERLWNRGLDVAWCHGQRGWDADRFAERLPTPRKRGTVRPDIAVQRLLKRGTHSDLNFEALSAGSRSGVGSPALLSDIQFSMSGRGSHIFSSQRESEALALLLNSSFK